jgi:hypothetical protein
MVSAIAASLRQVPHPNAAKPEASGAASHGRSDLSVGHRAKAMVAESGDTAPNALGKAASLIAQLDLAARDIAPAVELPADTAEPAPEAQPELPED